MQQIVNYGRFVRTFGHSGDRGGSVERFAYDAISRLHQLLNFRLKKTMRAMRSLLLLTALLASANSRLYCTVKDMEGLQIVDYAYRRVFRFTNYTGMIGLETELRETLVTRLDVSGRDFGYLIQLHQGFNRKLILLRHGLHAEGESDFGGGAILLETVTFSDQHKT